MKGPNSDVFQVGGKAVKVYAFALVILNRWCY